MEINVNEKKIGKMRTEKLIKLVEIVGRLMEKRRYVTVALRLENGLIKYVDENKRTLMD